MGADIGIVFLGFFWLAGMAVAVALPVSAGGWRGIGLGLGIALGSLAMVQVMHSAATVACAPGNCGNLGDLLDWIRRMLVGLSVLGAVLGAWAGRYMPGTHRRAAAR